MRAHGGSRPAPRRSALGRFARDAGRSSFAPFRHAPRQLPCDAVATEEPRDLLAERIRRLEARVAQMSDSLAEAQGEIRRASGRLDTLVDLVGRLSRVVDVQGDSLSGEESALERKVGTIEGRVSGLVDGLGSVVERLEALSSRIEQALER
jgi:hypothetical protein